MDIKKLKLLKEAFKQADANNNLEEVKVNTKIKKKIFTKRKNTNEK